MAKTANLNIRIDPKTKEAAEKLFANFGITTTDAINIFLHQSLLSGGLPFSVKLPEPNATTLASMKEIEEIIKNKTLTPSQSVDDFFKDMEVYADRQI